MRLPPGFNRARFRRSLGVTEDDLGLAFVALGQFERKGLPLVLEALAHLREPRLKLLVVGGREDLVETYRRRADRMGLSPYVQFLGDQHDVRPYLWSSDALVFPSFYEAFSLVTLEAAAAGLPLIVPPINGVEEFVRDGENGLLIHQTRDGVAAGLARFLALSPDARRSMGQAARESVQRYDTRNFVSAWRNYYAALIGLRGGLTATPP